jgi:tRNA(adenine34) deaminase
MNDLTSWMDLAIAEARAAEAMGEVPVGAVVVLGGEVIGRGHNRTEIDGDPSAHAEMVALRQASRRVGDWRLDGAALVATLEPCPMCAGAIILSRVATVAYATPDPRLGACGSAADVITPELAPHVREIAVGIRGEESAEMLRAFFRRLRERRG